MSDLSVLDISCTRVCACLACGRRATANANPMDMDLVEDPAKAEHDRRTDPQNTRQGPCDSASHYDVKEDDACCILRPFKWDYKALNYRSAHSCTGSHLSHRNSGNSLVLISETSST